MHKQDDFFREHPAEQCADQIVTLAGEPILEVWTGMDIADSNDQCGRGRPME